MKFARLFVLGLASLGWSACGGGPADEAGSDISFHGPPIDPHQVCKVGNTDSLWLTSINTTPSHLSGSQFLAVYGDPLWLEVDATSNWTGYASFTKTVYFDGVPVVGNVQPRDEQTVFVARFPNVTASTPLNHTFSASTACGTETAKMTLTKVNPTVMQPSINASAIKVKSGQKVTLTDSPPTGRDPSNCFTSLHLTGVQDDGKIVLDETREGIVGFYSKDVYPMAGTTYTNTLYCKYTPSVSRSSKVRVDIIQESGCQDPSQAGTWDFCLTCPPAFANDPSPTFDWRETACSYADAHAAAQANGINCTVSDSVCN
jgi:hypothetical protein